MTARVLLTRLAAAALLLLVEAGVGVALLVPAAGPAAAQGFFFPFFERQPRYREYRPYQQPTQPAPQADYSRAPAPKKPETTPTTTVLVVGDSLADWLAYGLEEALADTPEVGVVRKHRAYSGLIRYDGKQDWADAAREIVAAEKPDVVVVMLGLADRQAIREREPPANQDGQQGQGEGVSERPRQGRLASYEYRSEQWAEAYARKIDEMIEAVKSTGAHVFWVGLPAIRGTKSTSDVIYLNNLYRTQAQKAGITFVDVWDGFVDESGRYAQQGPDVEGQTRRLRTPDGVHFTKAGARKLAHYVEREIRRTLRELPVAMPVPSDPAPQADAPARPSEPAARPLAGPVLPLTATIADSDELLGGAGKRAPAGDPVAARVLVKGEPIAAPAGRADDFTWPRRPPEMSAPGPVTPPPTAAVDPSAAQRQGSAPAAGETRPRPSQAQRAPRPREPAPPPRAQRPQSPLDALLPFFRPLR